MWKHSRKWDGRFNKLCKRVKLGRPHDVLRHSYASYRFRKLGCDLVKLAAEMGNSPEELINSYKRNVDDSKADAWFGIMPPKGYPERIKTALARRQ